MAPDDHDALGASDAHDDTVETIDSGGDELVAAIGPLTARLEALLLAAERPLSDGKLGELLDLPGDGRTTALADAIAALNTSYEETGRTFRAERRAGGWQLLTEARFAPLVAQLTAQRQQSKLSHAALETLSIIAYRQPVMRAEVEAIRGVASGEVLRGLLERRLVKIVGRAEELGRPMLYGTTREFLNIFGLAGLDDLPEVEGLKRSPSYRPPAPTPEVEPEAEPEAEFDDGAADASGEAGGAEGTADDQTDSAGGTEAANTADADADAAPDAAASTDPDASAPATATTANDPAAEQDDQSSIAEAAVGEDDAGEPPVAESPARNTAGAACDT